MLAFLTLARHGTALVRICITSLQQLAAHACSFEDPSVAFVCVVGHAILALHRHALLTEAVPGVRNRCSQLLGDSDVVGRCTTIILLVAYLEAQEADHCHVRTNQEA